MRVYPGTPVDQEFKTLGDSGHSGSLNDRQFSFLRGLGYKNSLADMMTSWLTYNPLSLFQNNEQGWLYDNSDMSTMFQDSAGTTPVTAVGQPVGKQLDKSGRNNHRTQSTAASRPTFARLPVTGRRNTLLATEALATQSVAVTAAAQTLSFYGTGAVVLSGAYVGTLVGTGASNRVSLTFTPTAGSLTLTVTGSVTQAQLELGSTATNYQKVVSLYDITEAGVQTAYGLYYDGVDDFLVTPTITPGTDKVQVFAGVRKLCDAAAGLVVGNYLSTSTNGSFELNAPRTASSNFGFLIRGGAANAQYSINNFASPVSSVISAACDISGATIAEEIKPRVNGSIPTLAVASAGPAGGGNFLAYPVYFGRRGGTTLPFNGYTFREIGRFGPNLDAAQITNTEVWINQNTGAY